MNKKLKRVLTILGITIGASLAVAILIGILNALVANGTWSFGWSDYRYDESGYEVGEGSVFSDDLTTLSIDWIDGEVRIVSCGDQYISLSETSDEKLIAGIGKFGVYAIAFYGDIFCTDWDRFSFFLSQTDGHIAEFNRGLIVH